MTSTHDFSFGDHARNFDQHIALSIPGYHTLRSLISDISPRFVAAGSTVYDIGCSTGTLLRAVYDNIHPRRPDTFFTGIDIEPKFGSQWAALEAPNLTYSVADAREMHIERASLILSVFTTQFLPSSDKVPLLKRLHAGLIDGGCLLVAEKIIAGSGRMQDALTFPYYDFKQSNGFSAEEILTKERSLRGQMTLWTEAEAEATLRRCGFKDVQRIWGHFPFFCWLALK